MPRPLRLRHVVTAIRRASTAQKPPPRAYKQPPRVVSNHPLTHQEKLQRIDETGTVPKSARSGTTGRILTGCIGGAIAFYIASLAYSALQPVQNPQIKDLEQQKDVSARYDDTADSFDSDVALSEWLAGINTKRDRLAKMCKGHVLEVSCGTGRNLGYFDVSHGSGVASLTFVDLSPAMIDVCKRKWMTLYGSAAKQKSLKPGMQVRFITASALASMPSPPGDEGQRYDTILQTMGLCSTPSPVTLLRNLGTHLNTSNPDARILLLEHGRSYRDWLNSILDSSAQKHAEKHGCWFNRDIGALVAQAAEQAGLEVVRERRWHLGTTWVFELRAKTSSVQEEKAIEEDAAAELGQTKGNGWFKWS